MRRLTGTAALARGRKGRMRRLARRLGLPAALAVAMAAAWATGHLQAAWESVVEEAVETSRDAGFAVRHVLVSGRERTDRQTLIEALGIEIGEAMLAIDLAAARDRVAALAWVRGVDVRRKMPDTVVVGLVERRPLAIWQTGGELFVVDSIGEVIRGVDPRDHPGLFLVVGAGAPDAAAELLALMNQTPDLARRIRAAVRVGERRWKLDLADGIDVHLPEDGLKDAWHALAELQRKEELLSRDVLTIDLRLPDRLVVRLTPEARQRLEHELTEGEDT